MGIHRSRMIAHELCRTTCALGTTRAHRTGRRREEDDSDPADNAHENYCPRSSSPSRDSLPRPPQNNANLHEHLPPSLRRNPSRVQA